MKSYFFSLMLLVTACAPSANSKQPLKSNQTWELKYENANGQFLTVTHFYSPLTLESDIRTFVSSSTGTVLVPQEKALMFLYKNSSFQVTCHVPQTSPDQTLYEGTYTLSNNETRKCSFYLL